MANYTTEELSKFKKVMLYDIIENYCNKNNKHFTNLSKATKQKLIDLIEKYEMPKIIVKEEPKKIDDKDKYTNPFKVGEYTYNKKTDCDGDILITCYTINIYKVSKYTVSYTATKYGETKDYKQRKVHYFSSGDAYVNTEKYNSTFYWEYFKLKK